MGSSSFYLTNSTVDKGNTDEAIVKFCHMSDEEAESVAESVISLYSKEHGHYCSPKSVSVEEHFSDAYQSLLHGAGCVDVTNKILCKEVELRAELQKIIRERNLEVEQLKKEHSALVEKASRNLDRTNSETLDASEHFKRIHTAEVLYAQQISALMESQKREFRHFIQSLGENYSWSNGADIVSESNESSPEKTVRASRFRTDCVVSTAKREESFTIYLGAQMKTMHNLRLSASDPADLCRMRRSSGGLEDSRRLQMALGLYANQLSAVVLLVDDRSTYHLDFESDFYRACEQSTEFHFDDLSTQLEQVKAEAIRAHDWRCSLARSNNLTSRRKRSDLRTGDVYITRHSNLSQVYLAFHMVADDALFSQDINSRHPCINGLRNVIRVCSKFGVNTVSLPLLLVNRITEDLTVSWCLKRAELVFKCLKGFLMEGAALGGMSSGNFGSGHQLFYNVHLLVPSEISSEVFAQLTEMLPTIYHLVNPVVGR